MTYEDQNTPPVPPTDTRRYRSDDAPEGCKTLERGVTECPCGGRVDRERVFTGYKVVYSWDAESFPDDVTTEITENQSRDRDRCQRCGFGVDH